MKNIPFGRPMIGQKEKDAVMEVLKGPILVHGPKLKLFEQAFATFTGSPHAVAVSSCTAAMHLAYFNWDIGPGDEVIVPAQTHTATAHAVEFCGAKPVFVDSEMQTGNLNLNLIEDAISPRTRAIAVVHYLGMPVAMDRVVKLAKKNDLFVLEDCALAIGSYYQEKHAGLFGSAGCFSFYPVKHMTTAEGGMLITPQENLAKQIASKRAFGVDRGHGERKLPGIYDVNMLGYNYRLNEIQAALGIHQIERMDDFLKKRFENYKALERGLRQIDEINLFRSTHGDFKSSYYCLCVLLSEPLRPNRFEIVQYLRSQGVGTSVYYPKPVPHLNYYKSKYGFKSDSFPNAATISYTSIALPVGPHLNMDDMDYIVKTLKSAICEIK